MEEQEHSEDEVKLPEERVEDLEPDERSSTSDVGGGRGLNFTKIEIEP